MVVPGIVVVSRTTFCHDDKHKVETIPAALSQLVNILSSGQRPSYYYNMAKPSFTPASSDGASLVWGERGISSFGDLHVFLETCSKKTELSRNRTLWNIFRINPNIFRIHVRSHLPDFESAGLDELDGCPKHLAGSENISSCLYKKLH